MELKIIQEDKEKLIFEIDTNYGFANILVDELWKDKDTKAAAFNKAHPQSKTIKFIVDGKKPRNLVKNAIKRLKSQNKEFLKKIDEIEINQI